MGKFQFWLPTNLNRKQKRAVDSSDPIFLTGVPGSGKTVVSIYRLKNSKNGILFTYGKLLRKTIEEKVEDNTKKVVNIHRWHWDLTYCKIEQNLNDNNIQNTISRFKNQGISYDEIIVDEGQDLFPNSYKLFQAISTKLSVSADEAQQVMSKKDGSSEQDIKNILPNLKHFELDQIYRSSYEIYNFARQFVSYNKRANNPNLLERLKRENSGGDKPYLYILPNYNSSFEVMMDIIDDNPTDNIGILCPKISEVDDCYNNLKKEYEDISIYHSNYRDVPDILHNVIITTLKSAKGIEFDIVILPQVQNMQDDRLEQYFVGSTRAKTELHLLSIQKEPDIFDNFDKSSYKVIDRRGE
jgi:superfamily I DNA/RNA helicase